MSATKMSMMRAPPEEHFHNQKPSETSDQKLSRTAKSGMGTYSSLGNPDNHVLSLQVQNNARAPSVPNLLNVGSQGSSPTAESYPPPSYYTTTSRTRALSKSGLALTLESTAAQGVYRDENGNDLTPPSSANKVQFKTPRWRNSDSYATDCSPLSAGSGPTPTLLRKNSIDSLMRAAATIESNADLNKVYQDKMTSIIELKNKLSDEIRGWPISQSLYRVESDNTKNLSSHQAISDKQEQILLDQVSMENLISLSQVATTLKDTIGELIDLKNHTRYVEESIAAKLQQQLHIESPARVTLPPIESLTMNIREEQPVTTDYRFPESNVATPVTPTAPGSYSYFPSSQAHPQSGFTGQRGSSSWPMAPGNQGHRATLSDPSGYQERATEVTQLPQPSTTATMNGMPIKFKTPNSLSTTKGMVKSKSTKKKKKSLTEGSSQDYRRSLSHGLMLAETIRKNDQVTTSCVHCGESSTPEWRRGPYGNRTLCNACGLFYRKLIKKFGVKDANLLMRFKKQINPEDRRVPSLVNVPTVFLSQLNEDSSLDSEYNTICSSPGGSGI